MDNDLLSQRANEASIEADYNKAKLTSEMYTEEGKHGLRSVMEVKLAQMDADQLGTRTQIAKDQLSTHDDSTRADRRPAVAGLDRTHAVLVLTQRERDELKVRAGIDGVLQVVPVDVGQQVTEGTNLARVANPARLKAEIKIAETQTKDIQIGQKASIDTRNGIVSGVVTRIDPSVQNGTRTVDVSLNGELPKGAVPDLSVDGTIELERLNDVLYMGRPAFGQEQSTVTVFKVDADGNASRVQVKLGKESVSSVEILSGLSVGDRVILSDMSAWDGSQFADDRRGHELDGSVTKVFSPTKWKRMRSRACTWRSAKASTCRSTGRRGAASRRCSPSLVSSIRRATASTF